MDQHLPARLCLSSIHTLKASILSLSLRDLGLKLQKEIQIWERFLGLPSENHAANFGSFYPSILSTLHQHLGLQLVQLELECGIAVYKRGEDAEGKLQLTKSLKLSVIGIYF